MKYQNPRWTDKNTPIYEHVGDLVLIGISHGADGKKPRRKVKEFLDEILNSEHLILEGNSRMVEVNRETGRTNYETIAITNFSGPVHYLEEGSNFREMAERYGVRRELLWPYSIFRAIPHVIGMSQSPDEFFKALYVYLELQKQFYSGWSEINLDKKTLKMVLGIVDNFPKNPELIVDIGSMFGWYLARLREYELLRPKTLEYNSTLNGRKAEIVGANHVAYLARCLRGEDAEPPKEWNIFVDGLEPQYRGIVRKIEREIFPEPTPS